SSCFIRFVILSWLITTNIWQASDPWPWGRPDSAPPVDLFDVRSRAGAWERGGGDWHSVECCSGHSVSLPGSNAQCIPIPTHFGGQLLRKILTAGWPITTSR